MSSPFQPGHTVSVGCQECTCKGSTRTLSCQTRPCPLPPACPEPGFVPAPAALQTGQCCPQYTCGEPQAGRGAHMHRLRAGQLCP